MEALSGQKKNFVRDERADIFKGIGILFMLLGHISFGGICDYFIHAFHMPMFFFISGWLYKEKEEQSFSNFAVRKARALLIPYFLFGIMHYVIWIFMRLYQQEAIGVGPLIQLITVNTTNLPIAGALWFLTALFIANIIFFGVHKYIKGNVRRCLVCVAIVAIGHLALKILPFRLPYALDAAMIGVGLLFIGYILKQNKEHGLVRSLFCVRFWQLLLGWVGTFVLIMLNNDVNMRTGQYTYIPLFWINAILASVLLYNTASYIELWAKQWKVIRWGKDVLMGIGAHSIVYVCLNQIVIIMWKALLSGFEREDVELTKLIVRLLVLMLTIVTIEILEKCFNISNITRTKPKRK